MFSWFCSIRNFPNTRRTLHIFILHRLPRHCCSSLKDTIKTDLQVWAIIHCPLETGKESLELTWTVILHFSITSKSAFARYQTLILSSTEFVLIFTISKEQVTSKWLQNCFLNNTVTFWDHHLTLVTIHVNLSLSALMLVCLSPPPISPFCRTPNTVSSVKRQLNDEFF